MSAINLKVGSKVEYLKGGKWIPSTIYKATSTSIWFAGMGYASLRRTTFDSYYNHYRIVLI
jgi:hypothetical protein